MRYQATKTCWWLCYDTVPNHIGKLDPGQWVASSAPNIEQFDTEEEALARAIELGYEPDESELDT